MYFLWNFIQNRLVRGFGFATIVLPTLTSLTEFVVDVPDEVQPCGNVQ
jgi:hypothetical protein